MKLTLEETLKELERRIEALEERVGLLESDDITWEAFDYDKAFNRPKGETKINEDN